MEVASGVDDADLISLFFDSNLQPVGAAEDQATAGQGQSAPSALSPELLDIFVDVKVESAGNSESGDGSACNADLVGCASSFDEHSAGWAPSPPSASGADGPLTGLQFDINQDGCEQDSLHLKRKYSPEIAEDDESAEDKRKSRMMRNRESAQQSRQRKKLHMDELEQRVKELSEDNAKLTNENMALKQQLAFLCQRFGVHPVTGPFPPVGVVPGMVGTFPPMVPMPARLPLPGRRPTPLAASHKGRGRAKASNPATSKTQAAAAVLSVFAFVFIALPFLGPSSPGGGNISVVPFHTQGVLPAMQGGPELTSSPARRALLSLEGSNTSTSAYPYEEGVVGEVRTSVTIQPIRSRGGNSSLHGGVGSTDNKSSRVSRSAGGPWVGEPSELPESSSSAIPVPSLGGSEGETHAAINKRLPPGSGGNVVAGGLARASDLWALDAMAALLRDDGRGLALLDLGVSQERAVASSAGPLGKAPLGDGGQARHIPRHSFAWAGGLLSSFHCREILSISKEDLSAAVAKKVTVSPVPGANGHDDDVTVDGNREVVMSSSGSEGAPLAPAGTRVGESAGRFVDAATHDPHDDSREREGGEHLRGRQQQRSTRKLGLLRRALMGSSAPQGPAVPLPPPGTHPRAHLAAAAGKGGNVSHVANRTGGEHHYGFYSGEFADAGASHAGNRGLGGYSFSPFDGRDDIVKVSILVPTQGLNVGAAGAPESQGANSSGGGFGDGEGSGDEGGVGGGAGVGGMSQVLVVLLLNSAQYITYSCTLPAMATTTTIL